jgi:hypothetical protein
VSSPAPVRTCNGVLRCNSGVARMWCGGGDARFRQGGDGPVTRCRQGESRGPTRCCWGLMLALLRAAANRMEVAAVMGVMSEAAILFRALRSFECGGVSWEWADVQPLHADACPS